MENTTVHCPTCSFGKKDGRSNKISYYNTSLKNIDGVFWCPKCYHIFGTFIEEKDPEKIKERYDEYRIQICR